METDEKKISPSYSPDIEDHAIHDLPLDQVPKGRWERSWPTIACGAGLFSDGYLNGVRIFSRHLHL